MENKKHLAWTLYVGIFLLTVLVYTAALILQDSYPFGEKSFLTYDAYVQYKNMYHAMFTWLASDDKGTFLWDIGMGVDVYQENLYYCLSPFSLIVLLMGEKNIELSMVIMLIMKSSCLSPAALYFFRHTNKRNRNAKFGHGMELLVQLACSLAYGISGYVLAYGHNIMWLDALILLPFAALGVERLSAGRGFGLYVICMALSFIFNFYFSFYVCMFAVFYFMLEDRESIREFFKRGLQFAGATTLAFGIAGAVVVPAVYVVINSADSVDNMSLHETMWGGIGEFVASFYPLKSIECRSLFCNNSFCGSVALFMAILFVTSKVKGIKTRIKYTAAVAVLALALNWLPLNYMFHGFTLTHGLGNRFAIVLVFILIIMAYMTVQSIEVVSVKSVVIAGVFAAALFVIAMCDNSDMSSPAAYMIYMFLTVFVIMLMVLYVRRSVKLTSVLCICSILWIAELTGSAVYTLSEKCEDTLLAEEIYESEWSGKYNDLETETGERKTAMVMENVARYSQTSWYSSMANGNTIRAFSDMGLGHYDNVEYLYSGTTPLTTLMYNVRYVLTNESGTFGGYHVAESNDVYSLYEVYELAGAGFMLSPGIEGWTADGTALENQNEFVREGLGIDGDMFSQLDMSALTPEYLNMDVLAENVGYCRYRTTNAFSPIMRYDFDAEEDMELYICSSDTRNQYVSVQVDGETVVDETPYLTEFVSYAGYVKKGQHVRVTVEGEASSHTGQVGEKRISLYTFNSIVYEQAKAAILDETLTCTGFEDDSFHGKVTAQSDGILYLAYPYNDGFTVYVDGEETDKVRLGSGNMGVAVTAGEHEIVIEYNTPGLPVGIILSICGIAIFVGLSVWEKHKTHD